VFEDSNGNGRLDAGEPGIAEVRVSVVLDNIEYQGNGEADPGDVRGSGGYVANFGRRQLAWLAQELEQAWKQGGKPARGSGRPAANLASTRGRAAAPTGQPGPTILLGSTIRSNSSADR